jgi:hypothetical protein
MLGFNYFIIGLARDRQFGALAVIDLHDVGRLGRPIRRLAAGHALSEIKA